MLMCVNFAVFIFMRFIALFIAGVLFLFFTNLVTFNVGKVWAVGVTMSLSVMYAAHVSPLHSSLSSIVVSINIAPQVCAGPVAMGARRRHALLPVDGRA